MRYLFTFIVAICLSFSAFAQSSTPLMGIEGKIGAALGRSFAMQNLSSLDSLDGVLSADALKANRLAAYWRNFIQYYRSVYYLKTGDRSASEKAINQAIGGIESLGDKSAEDWALLAACQSFGLMFKNGAEAGALLQKVGESAHKALDLDPTNARAWFVLGQSDYYTPAQFGGGKKAEGYLLKAANSTQPAVEGGTMPTWGREQAIGMLIDLYAKQEKWAEAKQWLGVAERDYPQSQYLEQARKALEGK